MDIRRGDPAESGRHIQAFLRKLLLIPEQRLPVTLHLLERRQRAQDMERVLQAEKVEFQTTMEGLALRWEELCAQEAELRSYLLRFQHFIVENEVKSLQAVKKARRAQEIYNQKEQQLRILQEERQALVKRKQRVQAQIQQYRKFWDYLENSVEASEEFQAPGDVLSRFHTLVATSHHLQQVVQEGQSSVYEAKGQLSCFLEEKSDEVLQLDNQLGQLQTNLEHAQNQRLLWESRWAHIRNTATKKTLLIGAIKMATLNLFQCMPILDGSVAIEDTTRQLELVQQYIQDLSDICEATRRQLKSKSSRDLLNQK